MSENKAVIRRLYNEVMNKGNLSILEEHIAPSFVNHAAPPGTQPGIEGVKQIVTMYRTAFPDLRVTADEVIAEGDKVATRWTMHGTHRGEFMGIPPHRQPSHAERDGDSPFC